MSLKQVYTCNTCELVLETLQAQRSHMREPWHVYNIKRRIAELVPISERQYDEETATSTVTGDSETVNAAWTIQEPHTSSHKHQNTQSDDVQTLEEDRATDKNECLFCRERTESIETIVEHMASKHDFYIPNMGCLSSLDAFIAYLRTVIVEYHECLYCGISKGTATGARRHMLEKDHCLINLKREPELLEFWESSDSDMSFSDEDEGPESDIQDFKPVKLKGDADGHYVLPSGKTLGSKKEGRRSKFTARRNEPPAKTQGNPDRAQIRDGDSSTHSIEINDPDNIARSKDLVVSKRDAVALVGVSNQQMRNLITTQRKAQRQAAVVRASAVWADELGGRSQKHGKVKMDLRSG